MKKILVTLAVAACVASSYAQGTVAFVNGTTSKISTNGVTSGVISGLGNYYFALFYSSTATTVGGSSTATAGTNGVYAFNDANWSFAAGAYGTNIAAGGRFSSAISDASGNTVVTGVLGGNVAQFAVIGWSASIGSTVSALSTWYNNGKPSTIGWIGESIVSSPLTTGAGVGLPPGLFGSTGPITGFTLGEVIPVPEPGTIALAALGGASLLMFRRKK